MHTTRLNLGGICDVVVYDSRPDRNVRARIRDNAPHSHYAVGRDDIARELAAFKHVCQYMEPRVKQGSVFEMFGGSGWHSALIEKLVAPTKHIAIDRDDDCVRSIAASARQVSAFKMDATNLHYVDEMLDEYNATPDWFHADFNNLSPATMDADARSMLAWLMCRDDSYTTVTEVSMSQFEHNNITVAGAWIGALFDRKLEASWCWGPATMHLYAPVGHHPNVEPLRFMVADAMKVTILDEKDA